MSDATSAGSYAYRVGEIEVVAVSDGQRTAPIAEGFVLNAPFEDVKRAYAAYGVPEGHGTTPFNPTLIRSGGRTVLVDTGMGPAAAAAPAATTGFLLRHLEGIGVDPGDIDTVVISHFHADHVEGLLAADGGPTFPRAEISVPAPEWGFWMDDGEMGRAPAGRMRDLFANNRRIFEPLAERVTTHAWGAEVAPGITAVGTPGHSIGHTSYLVASAGESTFLIQDVSNHPAVSLGHPGWHLAYDQDPVAAEQTRRETLDWLVRDSIQVQGYHLPFPGRVHIERAGDAYRAVPIA